MKQKHYLIVLAVATALVGCDKTEKPPVPRDAVADLKDDTKQALKDSKDYLIKEKEEFIAASDKKIKQLDAKIDELAKKSEAYKDDAKVQADKELAALREQRSTAGKKFDEVKQATKEAWADTKAAFATAWDKVEEGYEKAKAKFK